MSTKRLKSKKTHESKLGKHDFFLLPDSIHQQAFEHLLQTLLTMSFDLKEITLIICILFNYLEYKFQFVNNKKTE